MALEEKPTLKLTGSDGNIFVVMGKAQRAARAADWSPAKIEKMLKAVQNCKSYDAALGVISEHFDVE